MLAVSFVGHDGSLRCLDCGPRPRGGELVLMMRRRKFISVLGDAQGDQMEALENSLGTDMRVLDAQGVIRLLRSEIARAGSQTAWAEKAGVERTYLNAVLSGRKPPGGKVITALGLRKVYAFRTNPVRLK